MTRRRLRQLLSASDGVTALEFAVVAPVFLTMLMGVLDIGHMIYGQSVLNGAVQHAAREASLETGDTSAADAKVLAQVRPVLPDVTISSTRSSYYDFSDIARAEAWNDADGNGNCNDGETYTDENGNGQWDADIGVSGNGGANDVVVYTVTATYEPVFRMPFLPDSWAQRSLTSSTVRKNQPFANQETYGGEAGACG
ncbi:MAG: pilus assembly protein [Sphingomonadales bacterium]|nr:pilus assembly protein [Sphingomonadales bacterium]MBD3774762.1 pilus assembly protein [Paracoccaceae bacterium]